MPLTRQVAELALDRYPEQAAAALETLEPAATVALLARTSIASAKAILSRLSPHRASAVVAGLAPARAALILEALGADGVARLLRHLEAPSREAILTELPEQVAAHVRRVLGFPPGTAGALMDPSVLALAHTLTAREALAQVRSTPHLVRYNLYVVDQMQRLFGVLNLRELLSARGRTALGQIMVRQPLRVPASADLGAVLAHPGWREVHTLPVVDDAGVYLGAIRYRVLRELEDELRARRAGDADTAAAFAQLIAAGTRGVLDALAGTARPGEARDA